MNEAIKNAWVAALRSGKYKQGFGRLRDESDSFCCLGVLCDLAGRKSWVRVKNKWRYADPEYQDQSCWSLLPNGIADTAGLTRDAQNQLAFMNDSKDWTFEDLADWIEENL